MDDDLPTKSQLKAAGDRIRKRVTGDLAFDPDQAARDVELVELWRTAHLAALRKTRTELAVIVSDALHGGWEPDSVTQRLKRLDSIVAKLVRDKPRLGEIEDIAGCRAVLPDRTSVERVAEQLSSTTRLEIVRVRNYNERPHAGGYRALHLWSRHAGFKVEIQLRTTLQQFWAESLEEADRRLGIDLKHENAPQPVLTYFREWALCYALLDAGVADSDVDRASLDKATRDMQDWVWKEGGAWR